MNPGEPAAPSPDDASARLIDAGHRLEDAGDIAGALRRYDDAIAASPTYLRAYLNRGNALQRLGRIDEAVAALNKALAIDPDSAPCRFNLGNVHAAAGDFAAALREYREALRCDAGLAAAGIAAANALDALGRADEAVAELRAVLAAFPDSAPAAFNLAQLLVARDECDEAEAHLRACVAADPGFLPAYVALGDLARNAGRSRDAEACYRRALAVDPHHQEAFSALLLSLNNRDDLTADEVRAAHLRFGEAFPPLAGAAAPTVRRASTSTSASTSASTSPSPSAPIRVGLLSGDFIHHPVALFLLPLLRHADRTQLAFHAYANNAREDAMTRELKALVPAWRNIAGLDDDAAAAAIRADGIDVLIDLSGHAARSRLLLFNRRCAPVQATWLGYLNTTGLRSADFRLCDRHTDPPGEADALCTERLIRLPDSQWCYAPVVRAPAGSPPAAGAGVVFGSFNHASKLSDRCIDLWCRVLRDAPRSRLALHAIPRGEATAALLRRFADRGVGPDRVAAFPRVDIGAYFAAIAAADVALDTFPYNGGTTTCDVLWSGVPLVALPGDRPPARSGVSLLSTLGAPELVAASDDDYVARNVRLATDAAWRQSLRATLRTRMQASPLMDAPRFARGFADALRRMLDAPGA